MPDPDQVRLLRACLPIPGLTAADMEWAFERIGRPEAGLRWLQPLLAMRLDGGIGDHPLVPKLKAARLYEASRRQRFDSIAGEAIARISERQGRPVVSRGEVLSLTAYPAPEARHLHDLDLIVEDRGAAETALIDAGYALVPGEAGRFHHASGMGVALHCTPLPADDSSLTREAMVREVGPGEIGGSAVLVPPDDLVLLHVLLLPSTRPATHLTWAADGWMAVQRGLPDWSRLAALDGPDAFWALRALRFLASALNAPVPPDVLDRLEAGAGTLGWRAQLGLLKRAARLKGRRALVRALIQPSS